MSTLVGSLVSVEHFTTEEKRLAKRYLQAVLSNTFQASSHYQVVSHPHVAIAIMPNKTNPPHPETEERLEERLRGLRAIQVLTSEPSRIFVVASEGPVSIAITQVTHANIPLMQETLLQEEHFSVEPFEADMRAWIALPLIIQHHWAAFNTQLRVHIMDCMMQHLESRSSVELKNSEIYCTFFASSLPRTLPSILVHDPEVNRSCELIELLTATHKNPILLQALQPALQVTSGLEIYTPRH